MKKKKIILASILGATALFAGATSTAIIVSNNSIKTQDAIIDKLEESTVSEDDLFSNGISSIVVNKEVKKRDFNQEIVSPVIGRQYAYDSTNNTVSIRFYAAITSLDVDAVWTRTLYNSDGTVNSALSTGTKKSTVAYSTLSYKDGDVTKYLEATSIKDENGDYPYNYFVIYTIKNIPIATYGTCTIDANVQLSNDSYVEVSKTGSVETNSTGNMASYELDLDMDNTQEGAGTKAGNQTYINGKVKTIYSTNDTVADASYIQPMVTKIVNNTTTNYEDPAVSKHTLSFRDDTANASDNYTVYDSTAFGATRTIGIYTFINAIDANNNAAIANNNDWLLFNKDAQITFTTTSEAKLNLSFYSSNNVKVYVGDDEISARRDGSYILPAGNVVIKAVKNGYLGKITLEKGKVVNVSALKAGVAGKQTLTARYGTVSTTYDVYVLDTDSAYKDADSNYVVTVDQSYTGTIGAYTNDGKGNKFNTISQALEFLQNTDFVPESANKVLNIGAGYYNEKLEITTPNLTINGSGTLANGTYSLDKTNYAAGTIIEFDTLYGVTDTNGFVHTTDSTQTVAIRETATNCKINGVTISNAWNCKAYFDAKGVSNEHRALALLVQSDQLVMNNCALLGYQDTVELFKGRQYFSECYISGTTDFIFGTNNTTLFDKCEIRSIYASSSNGGYINAFKGCSSGASDYVDYGAIYYQCNFTADSGVTNTSIARAWGAYSNVAVIECTLGSHISKEAYDGATSSKRYVKMNYEPTDSNVKFVEYNNSGSGALTDAVNGMTFLNSSTAANYHEYSVIFGKTNGAVSYTDTWTPGVAVQDTKIYYQFNGQNVSSGTCYNLNDVDIQNKVGTFGTGDNIVTVDATCTNGKFAYNNSGYVQFNEGTTLTFSVQAGTSVLIEAYPGQYNYTINGIAATGNTFSVFFPNDSTVVVKATSTAYLYYMIVNPDADEADCNATYEEVVNNVISENTSIVLGSNNTGLANAIGSSKTVQGTTLQYGKFLIDASNGKFYLNGGDNVQFNTGTKIVFTVAAGATVTVTGYPGSSSYSLTGSSETDSTQVKTVTYNSETEVTILGTGDKYLKSIEITYPSAINVITTNTDIKFGSTDGNYSTLISNGTITSTATIADHGGNCSMIYNGKIEFYVGTGATVTIYGNSSVDYTANGVAVSGSVDYDTGQHVVTPDADGKITIECDTDSNGDNYFYYILIRF